MIHKGSRGRTPMSVMSVKSLNAKMLLPGFNWSIKLALLFLIPFLGYLCRHFTTPDLPLAFSVLWAPAGVSLAFILLFGYEVLPFVFLGNLIYNVGNIGFTDRSYISILFDSVAISLGSFIQALIASFIIKKLSSEKYFYSVRDIFIFVLPAGLLSCMIASSVATFAVYINQSFTLSELLRTWMTFWLGDSLGVYIFTPLIVVLLTQKFANHVFQNMWEPVCMLLSFLFIGWISFIEAYPLPHLLIALCLWVTYRFRMHGAVIATFIVSLAVVVSSTLGQGVFVTFLSKDPLLYIISFLVVIIGCNLFVAALINERLEAWQKLEAYSGGLQRHLEDKTVELWEAHEEIYFKEKLASIGMMMAGIGRELKKPLDRLASHLNGVVYGLTYFDKLYADQKKNIDVSIAATLENNLETMRQNIDYIKQDHSKAVKIIDMVLKESDLTEMRSVKVKSINLQTLLNRCLVQSLEDIKTKNPNLNVIVVKEYDKAVEMIVGIPEDLTHAFVNLIQNALFALAERNSKSSKNYNPKLVIKTFNKPDFVVIVIWDNSGGMSDSKRANFFEPFLAEEGEFSGSGLSLAMTHDIIVQEHHGDISVESEGDGAQQITIKLPKQIRAKIRSPSKK